MPEADSLTYSEVKLKCDNARVALSNLATIKVVNPNTGKVEWCISDAHMYTGEPGLDDPHVAIIRGNPGSEPSAFDLMRLRLQVALGDFDAPEDPEQWLAEGLKKDWIKVAPKVTVPLNAQGGTLSASEIFYKICEDPDYQLPNIEMELLRTFAPVLAEYISGANVLELCGGPFKMERLLKEALAYQEKKNAEAIKESRISSSEPSLLSPPLRVIENDIERQNLVNALEYLEPSLPDISFIGVEGDCLDPNTYRNNITKVENWKYYNDDVLQAMRDDPAPGFVYVPAGMLNNLDSDKLLGFFHDHFKPGTIFFGFYDNTISLKNLEATYGIRSLRRPEGRALDKQFVLTGITNAVFENLEVESKISSFFDPCDSFFDPRVVGVVFEATPWGDKKANIRIGIFIKDRPDEITYITPHKKEDRHTHSAALNAAGFEVIGRTHLNEEQLLQVAKDADPEFEKLSKAEQLEIASYADASFVTFTHKGYATKARIPLRQFYSDQRAQVRPRPSPP